MYAFFRSFLENGLQDNALIYSTLTKKMKRMMDHGVTVNRVWEATWLVVTINYVQLSGFISNALDYLQNHVENGFVPLVSNKVTPKDKS